MKAELRAGATVEFTTPREMETILANHRRASARHADVNRPRPATVEGSITLDAAGAGTIDLGQPSAGRTWNLRRISVTYQDPTAALAAGVATLFRGNELGPFTFIERIPNGTQLPASDTFSADQVVLTQEEHLLVRITGGTATTPVFASAQVVDGPRTTVYEFDLPENGKVAATAKV